MQTWQEKALEMYQAGESKTEIARQLQEEMQADSIEQARGRVRWLLKDVDPGQKDEPAAPKKPERHIALENQIPQHHAMDWDGCEVIRFGLMGDTQINSKYTQLTHLHQFYDACVRHGITTVFHVGDLDEGEQMRPGHQYECYEQGADYHVDEIVRVYPRREGITTYFITGNHDYEGWWYGDMTAEMHALGYSEDEAMIKELQKTAVFRNANMAAAYTVSAQGEAMKAAA